MPCGLLLLISLIFASQQSTAAKIEIDGIRYETCIKKQRDYAKMRKLIPKRFKSHAKTGKRSLKYKEMLWHYIDKDPFAGRDIVHYSVPCDFKSGFDSFMVGSAYSGDLAVKLVDERIAGERIVKVIYTFVAGGYDLGLFDGAAVRLIDGTELSAEQLEPNLENMQGQAAQIAPDIVHGTQLTRGGVAFRLPLDRLNEFAKAGLSFRVYGRGADERPIHLPQGLIKAFFDSVNDMQNK